MNHWLKTDSKKKLMLKYKLTEKILLKIFLQISHSYTLRISDHSLIHDKCYWDHPPCIHQAD